MDTGELELISGSGVPLRWNSIPSGGSRNTPSSYMLWSDRRIQLKMLSKVETFKNKALLYHRRKRIDETALARTKPQVLFKTIMSLTLVFSSFSLKFVQIVLEALDSPMETFFNLKVPKADTSE